MISKQNSQLLGKQLEAIAQGGGGGAGARGLSGARGGCFGFLTVLGG